MATFNPVELAAEIVAAFVSYNPVPKSELPSLTLSTSPLPSGESLVPPDFELGPAQLHDLRQHTVRHQLTKFLACHTLDHLADFACKYLHREWLGDNLHA